MTEQRSIAQHDHSFGQDQRRPGETRTLLVIALTATTMVLEITAGLAFGSMALLADGLHMGSHAVALGISAFAYYYARRHARSGHYSFGTGKVNTLGGYTGAVLLAVFAVMMAWESVDRLINPVDIAFNQAIAVAVLGLLVNGASVFILDTGDHHHHHGHDHHHDHHHDHNLRSAYLHVLADALTSVLAIAALLVGKYLGWLWMDPVMGIVGALLVANWSKGLLRSTASELLDAQIEGDSAAKMRELLQAEKDVELLDLHLWSIGPGIKAAIVSLTGTSLQTAEHYHQLLAPLHIDHLTVELRQQYASSDAGPEDH